MTALPQILAAQEPPRDSAVRLRRLESEIQRLARAIDGRVGVGAVHLESGREVFLNRDERFPMASTFKIPLAVQLLTLVDSGAVSLDTVVSLKRSDLRPGSGTISELLDDPGVSLSLRNLLELMLLLSDNTATDVLWRVAGGGDAVGARLASLRIPDMSVNRPTLLLIAAARGVEPVPPETEFTVERFRELVRAVPPEKRQKR